MEIALIGPLSGSGNTVSYGDKPWLFNH